MDDKLFDKIYEDLTLRSVTIAELLQQDALSLCRCSPIRDAPKRPSGSKSRLTQLSKIGEGPAHCILRKWPFSNTPSEWGNRNRIDLLEQTITSGIWQDLPITFTPIRRRLSHSKLSDSSALRPNDNGHEQAFRVITERLLDRAVAAAILFFVNEWMKPANSDHEDFHNALETLRVFDVRSECRSDESLPTSQDVTVITPRKTPLPKLKTLDATTNGVCMLNTNAKSTAHAERFHKVFDLTSQCQDLRTVDGVMGASLMLAELDPNSISIADVNALLTKTALTWPLIATSHFAQVSFMYLYLSLYLFKFAKMGYELTVSTSSLGAFSSLWGFHRVCYLEYRPTATNILYVSENLAAHTSSAAHRTDISSNQKIVDEFYFIAVLSFLYTYGIRIVPPTLKKKESFLSYFQGLHT